MALYRLQAKGPGAGGDFWSTSMHVVSSRSISLVHTGWLAFLTSFLGTTLASHWPDDEKCNEALTTLINEANGKNISQSLSSVNHVGTNVGGTISQRSALVIGMRDGSPTRAGRGRMFWPPVAAGDLDNKGLMLSASATAIANGFKAAVDAMDVADQLVIYHRPVKADPANGVVARDGSTTAVTTIKVGIIPGTQRRRTNRVTNSYTSVGV